MKLERVQTHVLELPTEGGPESDGTLTWNSTTMVLAECSAGGVSGLGYTYENAAAAKLIDGMLKDAVLGLDAMDVPRAFSAMQHAIRNQGRPGVASAAISAVDVALWDLKACLLGVSLSDLLGRTRSTAHAYASGGFTSSGPSELEKELGGYREQGFKRVKIKVGRNPSRDPERVQFARSVLGPDIALMVDANGAYDVKQALAMAERFAEAGVVYFEEPVSSDDLDGLAFLRAGAPAGMAIAAGEYGYDAFYFRRMLGHGAVDVLQADATRCGGVTGFRQADALCSAHARPLSPHCAPSLHAALSESAQNFVYLEYFRDHARMEDLFFEGAPRPVQGALCSDRTRPGLGLSLRPEARRRMQH